MGATFAIEGTGIALVAGVDCATGVAGVMGIAGLAVDVAGVFSPIMLGRMTADCITSDCNAASLGDWRCSEGWDG